MKKLFILPIFVANIIASDFIEMSVSLKDCENSFKKYGGKTYSFFGEKEFGNSTFNLKYIDILEDTKKPPMSKDLSVQKLALKYRYRVSQNMQVGLTYLNITDNLMPTDGGEMFGLGLNYKKAKYKFASDFYKVIYDDFSVNQIDFSIAKKFKFGKFKFISKSIFIDNYTNTIFNPKSKIENAKDKYQLFGLMFSKQYKSYFGSIGGFLGNRLFAIMNNGYIVQHHSMEVGNSFAVAFGKKFRNLKVTLKYNQHTSKSLPINNENIKFKMTTLSARYFF